MKKSLVLTIVGALNIILAIILLIQTFEMVNDGYGYSFKMDKSYLIWLVSSIIVFGIGLYDLLNNKKN